MKSPTRGIVARSGASIVVLGLVMVIGMSLQPATAHIGQPGGPRMARHDDEHRGPRGGRRGGRGLLPVTVR